MLVLEYIFVTIFSLTLKEVNCINNIFSRKLKAHQSFYEICQAFNCKLSNFKAGERIEECFAYETCGKCKVDPVSAGKTALELCNRLPFPKNNMVVMIGMLTVSQETERNFLEDQNQNSNELSDNVSRTNSDFDRFDSEDELEDEEQSIVSGNNRRNFISFIELPQKLFKKKEMFHLPYRFVSIKSNRKQPLYNCDVSLINNIPVYIDIIIHPKVPQKFFLKKRMPMNIKASIPDDSQVCTSPVIYNTRYLMSTEKIFLRLLTSFNVSYRDLTGRDLESHLAHNLNFQLECTDLQFCTPKYFEIGVRISCSFESRWKQNQAKQLQSQELRKSAVNRASQTVHDNLRHAQELKYKQLKEQQEKQIKELENRKLERLQMEKQNELSREAYYNTLEKVQENMINDEIARKKKLLEEKANQPQDVIPPPTLKDTQAILQQKLAFSEQFKKSKSDDNIANYNYKPVPRKQVINV